MAWKVKAWIAVETDESLVFDDWSEADRHRQELDELYPANIYDVVPVTASVVQENQLLLLPESFDQC